MKMEQKRRKKIAEDHKVSYWTIVSNMFLVVITFWLGLTVQDMIAQKNADVSKTLADIEYVDKFKPYIDSLRFNYGPLLTEFTLLASVDENGNQTINQDDSIKMMKHFSQHASDYADFFTDLAYYYMQIHYYDTVGTGELMSSAYCLPGISVMIRFRDSIQRVGMGNNTWESYWPEVEKQLNKQIQSGQYVQLFGINKLYKTTINIWQKLYYNAQDVSKLIIASEIHALKIYNWIDSHAVYRYNANKITIKDIFAEEPLLKYFLWLLIIAVAASFAMYFWYFYFRRRHVEPTEMELLVKETNSELSKMQEEKKSHNSSIEKKLDNVVDSISCINQNIASLYQSLDILASHQYKELFHAEHKQSSILIHAILNAGESENMPKMEKEEKLTYKDKYYAELTYRKKLDDYAKSKGIPILEI